MPDELTRKTLRAWREERLLTLKELADLVGVKLQTVWNWENGRSHPGFRNLRKLAKELGVDPHQIILPSPKQMLTAA